MKNRIKALRKALNLTQQEFSDRIGIKRNTMANYEIGRNEPVDSVLSLIVREYNVNETWLRTGEGEMFRSMSRDAMIADRMGKILASEDDSFRKKFIEMLCELDTEQWELLEKMAKKLAGIQ